MLTRDQVEEELSACADLDSTDDEIERLREIVRELLDDRDGIVKATIGIFDNSEDDSGQWGSACDIVEAVYDLHLNESRRLGLACMKRGEHDGPIVVADTTPIDDGIGVTLRCEACKATTDSSIGLDELDWSTS